MPFGKLLEMPFSMTVEVPFPDIPRLALTLMGRTESRSRVKREVLFSGTILHGSLEGWCRRNALVFLGYTGGRNIDSSSAQHAKERFAPREHHWLIEGEMSDDRERPERFC